MRSRDVKRPFPGGCHSIRSTLIGDPRISLGDQFVDRFVRRPDLEWPHLHPGVFRHPRDRIRPLQRDLSRRRLSYSALHGALIVPTDFWLREQDSNLWPFGYEPNELPDCSTPQETKKPGDLSAPGRFLTLNFDNGLLWTVRQDIECCGIATRPSFKLLGQRRH